MLTPDLFLDCILLVINDQSDRTVKTVKELVSLYENESKNTTTIDNEITRFYIGILKEIIVNKITKNSPDDLRMILLKFKSDKALQKRRDIYDLLYDTFVSKDEISVDRLSALATRVQNVLIWHRANKMTRAMFGSLNKVSDYVNPDDQITELQKLLHYADELKTVFVDANPEGASKKGLVDCINFTDKESIAEGVRKFTDRNVKGVIKLGLQGLNRMCGRHGGLVRGESLVVYALPHMYKSGLLQSIAMWSALYNVPVTTDGRKPMVWMISLENESFQNLVWMGRHQYMSRTGRNPDELSDEEIVNWVYDLFSESGFTLVVERYLPSDFGFDDFLSRYAYYENSGYEIWVADIDYINLMKKGQGDKNTNSGNHLLVRELFSSLCNFNKSKGTTLVSAHPLNRKAAELVATHVANVVKRFSTDHVADSVDVAREVDMEIYLQIEKNHAGIPYLTAQRGKHRYVDDTPERAKYFAYRFHQWGIPDDIGKKPAYVMDIYADAIDNGDAPVDLDAPEEVQAVY